MLNLYPRMAASPSHDDYRICYAIVVACVSLLLFCVLAASVSIAKACGITGMIVLFFGVVGCFAPATRSTGNRTHQAAAAAAAGGAVRPARCSCGLPEAAISALPMFAYECAPARGSGKPGSCVLCSVCLEVVQGGEMVRRLPVCNHLFHVECIDLWLHSHRTCPLCRCDLSPLAATVKAAAAAASADALPPV